MPSGRASACHVLEVLLGQDLRRRHETGLVAVLHCHERGDQGDDGLAASHIALHQPVHGPVRGHVCFDLGDHPFLRSGQAIGQLFPESALRACRRFLNADALLFRS